MSNFSDFFPAAAGGGSMPIIQEFTSSGTFTPTQALIDAGGRLAFILVGAGGKTSSATLGAQGGFVMLGYQTLTSTTGCAVTIGSGTTSEGATGGNSSVAFSSAGGTDETATGGSGGQTGSSTNGPWGPNWAADLNQFTGAAGPGYLNMGVGSGGREGKLGSFGFSSIAKNYGSAARDDVYNQPGVPPSGPGFLRIIYFE